ncbi:AbrB/MazE/SpoVT family DNA-binding domain-containing protein [Pseudomonas sp. App30]|uniref:AbrB/MazE/SpoVT family DNA-binding domain-containing protein n=1 Tax=Pseudomonas sp. App30 TaxID=3068990 RepID=UPI003A809DF9
MDVKIQQWGNSAGLRVPATVLKQLGISMGDTLSLDILDGNIVLTPASKKPRYTLAELLDQCDSTAPETEGMADWHALPPVGREV